MVAEFVKHMLNVIGQGVDQNTLDLLAKTPEGFNQSLYDLTATVSSQVAKPVTSAILAVVVMLQVAQIGTKADGDRELGVKLVAMTMIQCAILIYFAQNASLLLQGINEIASWAMTQIGGTVSASASDGSLGLGDHMASAVEGAGVMEQGIAVVVLLIPFLVSVLAGIVVLVVLNLRFIQIYLLASFAPMPVAFFGNDHTRQMGVGYFKQYAQVLFQSVTLFLAVAFYQRIQFNTFDPSSFHEGDSFSAWIISNFGGLLIAGLLLLGVVAISNKTAKALFGD